jgi:F420-dependent oxidoreductase-like protein
MTLKLNLMAGYWAQHPPQNFVEMAQMAERLGYYGFFTAEAWGSDALTPLAWVGAQTSRIKLGTAIAQISARTPTSLAMHAMTLDHLTNGRMILGLGVSGPQVVEGWYGQGFSKPLSRTRACIDIIRQVLAREEPVQHQSDFYTLPYPEDAPGSWGMGKPLKSIVHPLRSDLPIFLGAEGPKNVKMATEICDGWYPLYYSPTGPKVYAEQEANLKPGFEIFCPVRLQITDDVEGALNKVKENLALYVGGMGSRDKNFHNQLVARMGYEDAAKKIQDLFLDGKKREAVAAVPDSLADEIALIGPPERIKDRLAAWDESPVTGLMVWANDDRDLAQMAELVLAA